MSIVFFFFGLIALIGAFMLEGGAPGALLGISPALIVFGGVIGATGLTTPTDTLIAAVKAVPLAFKGRKSDPIAIIKFFNDLSQKARKDGLLALDAEINGAKMDPFARAGLMQAVDGVHDDVIRSIMENEIMVTTERHAARAKVFESAGGYAPTMGIIGTVMGLVHVLGNLSEPDTLGPLIAAAFLATLYGIASANLIFLPIGGRLKAYDAQEVLEKNLIIEGVISIQNGDSPPVLTRKLRTFLDAKQKTRVDGESGGGKNSDA
jgi:chemotaxis protein MotA